MTFQEACDYIESLGEFQKRPSVDLPALANGGLDFTRFGLARAAELYRLLGNPQSKLRVVHVGGTSGKGSTAMFIHSILMASGLKTGLYTSPALSSPLDRTRINGAHISQEKFAVLVEEMRPFIEQMKTGAYGAPSEFEVSVGLAFLYFAREQVDFAVIEVGVGGLIDATNVVDSLVSVITNVSLAHTRILGGTIESIALNKAGIIKKGNAACVTAAEDEQALEVIASRCRAAGVPLKRVMSSQIKMSEMNERGSRFSYQTSGGKKFNDVDLRMIGDAQITNACCAIEAVDALRKLDVARISSADIHKGLASAQLEARLEIISTSPRVLLDGAHNHAKAEFLARTLRDVFRYDRLILVFGVKKKILKHLAPLASVIIITEPELRHHQVARAEDIAEFAAQFNKKLVVVKNPFEALEIAKRIAMGGDLICVAGSLHLVGMLRKSLNID